LHALIVKVELIAVYWVTNELVEVGLINSAKIREMPYQPPVMFVIAQKDVLLVPHAMLLWYILWPCPAIVLYTVALSICLFDCLSVYLSISLSV